MKVNQIIKRTKINSLYEKNILTSLVIKVMPPENKILNKIL
jgi:hypothetical protein